MAKYAEKNGKPMPEIQDYKYGMKIDVAKFVRQSQDPRTCQVYPRLMTFEDSYGHAQDCLLLDVFAMHQQQVVNDLNRTIREFINARQCLAFLLRPIPHSFEMLTPGLGQTVQ